MAEYCRINNKTLGKTKMLAAIVEKARIIEIPRYPIEKFSSLDPINTTPTGVIDATIRTKAINTARKIRNPRRLNSSDCGVTGVRA